MTIRYHQRRDALVPDYQCVDENIQRHQPRCLNHPRPHHRPARSANCCSTPSRHSRSRSRSPSKPSSKPAPDEADQLRRSHVERARQHAELARRRYLAVDPDNRLVADTLEADWNDRRCAPCKPPKTNTTARPPPPTPRSTRQRKTQIRQLATDFPKLWTDPATPARERKRIARLLIEDVTLNKTDQIHLHVRFRGGQTTSLTIPIPLNSWQARQTDPDTLAMLDRLLDDHTDGETAHQLNAAGRRTGMNKPFTHAIVVHLRRAHHLPSHHDRLRARGLLTDQADRRNDSACTPARSTPGTAPDCSPPTKPTTKTSDSSTHPTPTTHASQYAKAGA